VLCLRAAQPLRAHLSGPHHLPLRRAEPSARRSTWLGGFDFTPDRPIWIAAAAGGLLAAAVSGPSGLSPPGRQKLSEITVVWPPAPPSPCFAAIFFFTGLLPAIGIYAQQWKTQANGFLLNFMAAMRYSFVSAPDNYSAEAAQENRG
jgi:hypothetical protein